MTTGIALIGKRTTLPGGANLYREGNVASRAYVLVDGKARISFGSNSGRRFIVKIAKPGEILGLASVLTGQLHTATADLIFPGEVSEVRREDLLTFLRRCPEACWEVMHEMGLENERTCARLRTLGLSNSVSGRLARLILEWSSGAETKPERRYHVPMTHYDIGDSIGVSRESVTRAINDLQNEGVIEVRGALLTILKRDELEVRSLR